MRANGVAALIGVALLASAAQAQVGTLTWEDPTLPAAVASADLIVLGTATKVGTEGAAFAVVRTIAGPDRKGATLIVVGLHHARRSSRPPVKVGDRAYLILRGKPAKTRSGFIVPTPTFGRFPIQTKPGKPPIVVASMGGVETFLRLALAPAEFEAILRGLASGKAPELVVAARKTLEDEAATPEQVYLALRKVAFFGAPSDQAALVPIALRVFDDPRYRNRAGEQVRLASLRALGRLGGPAAVKRLVAVARQETKRQGQRSVALAALGPLLVKLRGTESVRQVVKGVAALAERASAQPITFGSIEDPRTNAIDSPLSACLRTLAILRPSAGVRPALLALERDDMNAIVTGLTYFRILRAPQYAGGIAHRMRPDDSDDPMALPVNRLFGSTLKSITKQDLGHKREAWLKWWRTQELGPKKPSRKPGGR